MSIDKLFALEPARHACRVAAWIALCATATAVDAAAPVTGDAWAYRVVNGYNHEVLGKIQYRVDKVDAGRVMVAVSSDLPALGRARTEVLTPGGNWLRHAVINHDQPVEYDFAQPYPAYEFPLDAGKSWSTRVNAVNAATGRHVSVRVDGEVLGGERVTVPAGAFDTVKIRRRIYAGDFDGARAETHITEIEWYAQALGRAVRIDRDSNYMDRDQCSETTSACRPVRGDWHIFELAAAEAPR